MPTVPVLQFNQPVQLQQLRQGQLHQECDCTHGRGQICQLHPHGFQKAIGICHIALAQDPPQPALGIALGLCQPCNARPGVDGFIVCAVPAGMDAVEGVINIAIPGVDHDIDAERLLCEMLLRQLEPHQLLQHVEQPVPVLAGKTLRVRAVAGGQFGADLLLQFLPQRPLAVLIPLVQLLPESLHRVVGPQDFYGCPLVHLIPVIGVNLVGERAVRLAVIAQERVQNIRNGLFQLLHVRKSLLNMDALISRYCRR